MWKDSFETLKGVLPAFDEILALSPLFSPMPLKKDFLTQQEGSFPRLIYKRRDIIGERKRNT